MPSIHEDLSAAKPPTGAFGLGVAMMSPVWAFYAAAVTAGVGFWSMARASGLAHGTALPQAAPTPFAEPEPGPAAVAAYEPGDEHVARSTPNAPEEVEPLPQDVEVPAELVAGEPAVVAEAMAAPRRRRKAQRKPD